MEKIKKLLSKLNRKKIPRHIAVIMDGNGRWAKSKRLPRITGHRRGVEVVREIVRFTGKNLPEVKVLTLYVFSTENWSRPRRETWGLMALLEKYLISEIPELNDNNVKLHWIGRREGLSKGVMNSLHKAMQALEENTGLTLNLAINYGGRTDIVEALKKVAKKVMDGKIDPGKIDEAEIEGFLYTRGLPSVDLLIRTGGEMRVSNFLLWQIAYSELLFTPVYWPAFTPPHLVNAILDYQGRERRFGTIRPN